MVIQHIYLYSLDTVGRNSRFGIRGTSSLAIRLIGNWLSSYKIKKFSVITKFLENEAVNLKQGSKIYSCLREGGIALCNILLSGREEHYLMIIRIEKGWVYCFDPYFRTSIRGRRDCVEILDSDGGRSPNLRIRDEWMDQEARRRFCFGPVPFRECLLIWRN